MKARIALIAGACALIAGLLGSSSALAHRSHHSRADRNHDGLPDSWERKHHLRLRAGQAAGDQDHDKLRNRAEFLAGTDPRDPDSDDDGVGDAGEGAGRVVSYADGVLTIELFGSSDKISGKVTSETEFECDDEGAHLRAGARSAQFSGSGELELNLHAESGGERGSGGGEAETRFQGEGEFELESEDRGDGPTCDAPPTKITAGTVVKEAELKVSARGAVWSEIELLTTP